MSLVEQLRFDAARCELQFSKGVATNIDAAANRIEELEAALTAVTRERDEACATRKTWGVVALGMTETAGMYQMRAEAAEADRDALAAKLKEAKKLVKEIVTAEAEGVLHVASPPIGGGGGDMPHPWHEEWFSFARAFLAAKTEEEG